jgi:transcriptional regulator with XRE-family HTH domain
LKHALWVYEGLTGEKPTQSRLAELVGKALGKKKFRQTTAGGWLAGAMPRTPEAQLALAEALRVDPGWLYFGPKSRAPAPVIPAHLVGAANGIEQRAQQTLPHHGHSLPDNSPQAGKRRRKGNG